LILSSLFGTINLSQSLCASRSSVARPLASWTLYARRDERERLGRAKGRQAAESQQTLQRRGQDQDVRQLVDVKVSQDPS
jgi:hypothetical protein